MIVCQWAKHLGATVIGTTGSGKKAELARKNGCDHPILYREEDFPQRVKEVTGGRGVDVAGEVGDASEVFSKKSHKNSILRDFTGDPGRTRTPDLMIRRLMTSQ